MLLFQYNMRVLFLFYLYATVPLLCFGSPTPPDPTTKAEPKSTSLTSNESVSEEWSCHHDQKKRNKCKCKKIYTHAGTGDRGREQASVCVSEGGSRVGGASCKHS